MSVKILKKFGLGDKFSRKTRLESNVTTAWGVDWDELYIARDLLQNFYDANKDNVDQIIIERLADNTIIITGANRFNLKKLFYLGSEKTSEDVGKYGEGFKAAAVCLLRDYNISPIAVSGSDIYVIHLSESAVPGTKMYPLVYDYYVSNFSTPGTKLILENCSPLLAETLQQGLSSFFFTKNHPIVGEFVARINQGNIKVYQSKNGEGYIYFEKLLRAELGKDLPLVFVFNYPYVDIKRKIGRDRDRRTFSTPSDLKVFYSKMDFEGYQVKKILEITKPSLWGKGKGHEIFRHMSGWRIEEETKTLFGDKYFAKSSTSKLDNLIKQAKIEELEENWKLQGRICLPSYFHEFGVISAKSYLEDIDKKAKEEERIREQRKPTPAELKGIQLCAEIMDLVAPEVKYVFDRSQTVYTIGETESVLGELKDGRSYHSREVYLAAKIFTTDFAEFFSIYIHEHVHIFGHDGSRGFTDSLTRIIESIITYRNRFDSYQRKWEEIREEVLLERSTDKFQSHDFLTLIDQLSNSSLRNLVREMPEEIVFSYLKKEKIKQLLFLLQAVAQQKFYEP